MNKDIPRLRMFAGPNGSGKSTIKSAIDDPNLLGIYINPDELEEEVRQREFIDFAYYDIKTSLQEVLDFFIQHPLLKKADLTDEARKLRFSDEKLIFHNVSINAYFASVTGIEKILYF